MFNGQISVIRRIIYETKNTDLKITTIEALYEQLSPLFQYYGFTAFNQPAGLKIFRISISNKATNIRELSYPPADKTPLGRVNRENEPVFYGTINNFPTALAEYKPNKGDTFSLSLWTTTEPIHINHVGYIDRVIKKRGGLRLTEELEPFKAFNDLSYVIGTFLSEKFTEEVNEDEKHKYKLTIAIAEHLLRERKKGLPFEGLRYPSVATYTNTDNIALSIQYANRALKILEAHFLEILDVRDDGYVIKIWDATKTFSENGDIEWAQPKISKLRISLKIKRYGKWYFE